MCDHDVVIRQESLNPRMPLVRWACFTCGQDFSPQRHRFIEWADARLEARRFRRELKEWRNG
jgi:hypothetical protein